MKKCIFCGKSFISKQDDEGLVGYCIGEQGICESCINELKEALAD